ncbi:hypothetical protein G6F60_014811 [Rhizopus arrhizus]|nr:hypothetical protein G6F60_014811 [Rhizopus arrhizus]
MASASSSASAAVPRQKLSWRLRFQSALASPSASPSTPWKASVCAVLLHRLPPAPISATSSPASANAGRGNSAIASRPLACRNMPARSTAAGPNRASRRLLAVIAMAEASAHGSISAPMRAAL